MGVRKRSDVFITDKYLTPLEKDFCKDLLLDTSDALRWLESTNQTLSPDRKKSVKSFTFDFKALYDSLQPILVLEAINRAMDTCRPDWSNDFKQWILRLVEFVYIIQLI